MVLGNSGLKIKRTMCGRADGLHSCDAKPKIWTVIIPLNDRIGFQHMELKESMCCRYLSPEFSKMFFKQWNGITLKKSLPSMG